MEEELEIVPEMETPPETTETPTEDPPEGTVEESES